MEFCFYSGFNQMLQAQGLEETARWAQEKGFCSVEFLQLSVENWHAGVETPTQAKQVKQGLKNYGLTTACYSVGVNLLNGQDAINRLKEQAVLAAELGSPYLHHTLIDSLVLPPESPSFDEVFDRILDAASEVALYCQSLGLTCLYEEQGMYFNGVKNFGRFFNEIIKRCSNVGICGDFGNIFFADESPETFFKTFKSHIKHVHVKDFAQRSEIDGLPDQDCWLKTKGGSFLKDVPLGEGIIPIKACFQQLREADYRGKFSLELVDPTVNDGDAMCLCKTLF